MSLSHEDQLMEKIAQGCSKSFGALFDLYGSVIFGYACKLIKDKASAEDIAQEVWVKIAKAAPSYQGQGQFKSWALTMTRNLCFNKLKADKRLQFYEDISDLQETIEQDDNMETKLLNESKMSKVNEVLNSLPENQRVSLLLVTVEGLSYEEVAEQLSISVGATKSLIHRARKTLNEKLGKEVL